jgi:hypothetical protein
MLFVSSSYGSEAAFEPLFEKIKNEYVNINNKKAELASNFEKMRNLSAKNTMLENEIAKTLQELSLGIDMNYEILYNGSKSAQVDEATAISMEKTYDNINKEIEKTWTISK